MKPTHSLIALALLSVVAAGPCLALVSIDDVTPERAKALGVVVRTKPVGKAIYVWLEFKAAGSLKNFEHAQLAVESGDRYLTATLNADRTAEGGVTVFLAADPATMDTSTVTLLVRHGERTMTGHRIKLKDFVGLKAETPKL